MTIQHRKEGEFAVAADNDALLAPAGASVAEKLASNFAFARYLMTGVHIDHIGSLAWNADCPFTYDGCIDAPAHVAGGSHESGSWALSQGVSTSIAERAARGST